MDSTNIPKAEESCVVYPWVRILIEIVDYKICHCCFNKIIFIYLYIKEPCYDNEMQMKASFEDNYLDHLSNLKIESNPSQNTLTTIACGVCTLIYLYIYKHKLIIFPFQWINLFTLLFQHLT